MRLLVAAAFLVAASSAMAQMYRWTDQSGRVHFSDTPPPAAARNVQRRSSGGTQGTADGSAEPYAVQIARKNYPVKLYSAEGCGAACDEARKLLNTRGVPFNEVSISTESQIAELKQLIGSASVPALVVGNQVQKGFEAGAYHAALDSAGYPKPGILQPRRQSGPRQMPPKLDPKADTGENQTEEPIAIRGPYAPAVPR